MRVEPQSQIIFREEPVEARSSCLLDLILIICDLINCCFGDCSESPELSQRDIQIQQSRKLITDGLSNLAAAQSDLEESQQREAEAWQNLDLLPRRIEEYQYHLDLVNKKRDDGYHLTPEALKYLDHPEAFDLHTQMNKEEKHRREEADQITSNFLINREKRHAEHFDGLSYDHFKLSYVNEGRWVIGANVPMNILAERFKTEIETEQELGDFLEVNSYLDKLSENYIIDRINRGSLGWIESVEIVGLEEAEAVKEQKKKLAEFLNEMES